MPLLIRIYWLCLLTLHLIVFVVLAISSGSHDKLGLIVVSSIVVVAAMAVSWRKATGFIQSMLFVTLSVATIAFLVAAVTSWMAVQEGSQLKFGNDLWGIGFLGAIAFISAGIYGGCFFIAYEGLRRFLFAVIEALRG